MKKVLILFMLVICMAGCQQKEPIKEDKLVSSEVVKEMYDNKVVTIIDVRTEDEYNEKHIKGSINIPVDDIENKISYIATNKDANIVVYCKSGNRSSLAKSKLKSIGYTKIYDLGSINNWQYEFE